MPDLKRSPDAELERRLEALQKGSGELERRCFQEAVIAACALVAMADGSLDPGEAEIVDRLRQRLEGLAGFDASQCELYYREYVEELFRDPEAGRALVLGAVDRIGNRPEGARALVQVCLAIAVSDHVVTQSEYQAIRELSERLDFDLEELEA